MAMRTASAGSHISGLRLGNTTFISGRASGFSASLASPVSAADLSATLAPSNARSPVTKVAPSLAPQTYYTTSHRPVTDPAVTVASTWQIQHAHKINLQGSGLTCNSL